MYISKIDKVTFGGAKLLNFYLHCCGYSMLLIKKNVYWLNKLLVNIYTKGMELYRDYWKDLTKDGLSGLLLQFQLKGPWAYA